MTIWEKAIITNGGLALQTKLHSGTTLSLTRAAVGTGYADVDTLQNLLGLTNEEQEVAFATQSYPEEGKCAVPVKLTNENVDVGYTVTQVGIFAFDPDEGEILYLIAQAVADQGTVVPSKTEMPGYSAEWTFYIQYGNADGVTVTVDPSNTITQAEAQALVDAHADDTGNPHGVTAAQVGLDLVDNTADADKRVAFASEAATARKTTNSLVIRLDGGRTEGMDQWTYNGSAGKAINITPEKIGAATEASVAPKGLVRNKEISTATETGEVYIDGFAALTSLFGEMLTAHMDTHGAMMVSVRCDMEKLCGAGLLTVSKSLDADGLACASATFVTSDGYKLFATAYNESGDAWTFNNWEWENPPMNAGVEYATTQRWQGKTVYCKVVNIGALPQDTEVGVETGLDNGITVIRMEFFTSDGYIGHFLSDATVEVEFLYLGQNGYSDNSIIIRTSATYSTTMGYATLHYIKS